MKTRSKGRAPAVGSRRRRKASTAEIVPDLKQGNRVPTKWRVHYNRLMMLRDHLIQSRGGLRSDVDNQIPTYGLHMADAATDNYDRDLALSMLSSEQNAIYEIEQALKRIRDGVYGICEMTGKPIPQARLNAVPWTRFSAGAENDLELRGKVAKPKLGDVSRVLKEVQERDEDEIES